ncbi:MAG: CPBP family intramembrane glutamic endopeptidase [Myxococcota bacterium]
MNATTGRDGLLRVGLYLTLWLGVVIALNIVAVVGWMLADPELTLTQLAGQAMPTWLLVGITLSQFTAMYGLTEAIDAILGRWHPVGARLGRRERLAWNPVGPSTFGFAVLVGMTVGALGGWFALALSEILSWEGALDFISGALLDGPIWSRVVMGISVSLVAPLVEELVFRGWLWDALAKRSRWPGWVTCALTTVLFAAYHLDPVQSPAVLTTGAVLGWIRLRTGSVVPCIVVHAVNNSLAVALVVLGIDGGPTLPWCVGLYMLALGSVVMMRGGGVTTSVEQAT